MVGVQSAYAPTTRSPVLTQRVPCYATWGTDLACDAMHPLRDVRSTKYSGTGQGRVVVLTEHVWWYQGCSTDRAYGGIRAVVLTERIVTPGL
eukprot:239851-Rhodomonas_salina.1